MELRPYQSKIIVDLRDGYIAGFERQLLVLATGGGKTVIFSYITKSSSSRGKRTIIMAHRSEILDQISATLTQFGVDHGMITAKSRPNRDKLVQVASIQTLVRRFDLIQTPDLLIFDEAHHMAASQWSKVLAQYPKAKVLGVTATPERLDGRGLGEFFQRLVRGPEVQWLIDSGYLSRPVYYAPASPIDFSQVKLIAGEYAKDEAEAVMDRPSITGDIVSHYKKLCAGKRAIAFCISIKHAEHITAQFAAAGVPSATIDGKLDPEVRRQRVEDLRAGRILVMTSCEIVNEGFDLPSVDVGILCRPTKSLALHLQQIGRTLRTRPGKAESIILDHVGNCITHGLAEERREWSLDGKSKSKRPREAILETRQCEDCFAIYLGTKCPQCGTERESKVRELEIKEGELKRLETEDLIAKRKDKIELKNCRTYEDVRRYGASKGYKPGWAYHRWKIIQHFKAKRDNASAVHTA